MKRSLIDRLDLDTARRLGTMPRFPPVPADPFDVQIGEMMRIAQKAASGLDMREPMMPMPRTWQCPPPSAWLWAWT